MSKPRRTQYFTNTLQLLMERNRITQAQIVAATGIAFSRVNGYVHGNYRTIRPDHLEKLVRAVACNARERSELIKAYLMDLLPEAFQGVISLQRLQAARRVKTRFDWDQLPATTAQALAGLQTLSRRSAKARARVQWFFEILAEAHAR